MWAWSHSSLVLNFQWSTNFFRWEGYSNVKKKVISNANRIYNVCNTIGITRVEMSDTGRDILIELIILK